MSSNGGSSPSLGMTLLGDRITAALTSLWPWSTASVEARRIALDGHAIGTITDVYYLVSFDDPAPDSARAAIRAAGFTVGDPAPQSGFVTVRASIRLGAYDLAIADLRLERIAGAFGGFATLIGAARMTSEETARAEPPRSRHAIAI